MLKEINLSRADLNLLVVFEVLFRERHVARAAAQLNLSPSAVSHGLSRLRRLLNDPLFVKNPKGVVPTQRAMQLAEQIGDILARVRGVVGSAQRFDAATSTRRFTVGTPDALAAVTLLPFLGALAREAPSIDVSVRALMPQTTFSALDAHEVDVAISPVDDIPPRFRSVEIFVEDFVIAMRADHPLSRNLSFKSYCAASHLVVSMSGDPNGLVDQSLKKLGLSRRVALSVPSFILALAVAAETDLLAALPRMLVQKYAKSFGLRLAEVPMPLPDSRIRVVAPKASLTDAGTAWLFELLARTASPPPPGRSNAKQKRRAL